MMIYENILLVPVSIEMTLENVLVNYKLNF